MYSKIAHSLICMVIIHSNFNDPPQHPQLNDYSFSYFQSFTGSPLIIAILIHITVGAEWMEGGILMDPACLHL